MTDASGAPSLPIENFALDSLPTIELCMQLAQRLERIVARQFLRPGTPLRRVFDPADIVQETLMVLVEGLKKGRTGVRLAELDRFMIDIARKRCRRHFRDFVTCGKRSITREEPYYGKQLEAKLPDPAAEIDVMEQWETFQDRLTNEERRAFEAACFGAPASTIASDLHLSIRTAQRIVHDVRKRWATQIH